MFERLREILVDICRRLDGNEHESRDLRAQVDDLRRRQQEQASRMPATLAFGWDYVAMVRRLAVLEEHVDDLLAARNAAEIADKSPSRFPVGTAHESEPASRSRAF